MEAGGTSGTVESVRIFNTVLKTPDNRIIIVPNSLVYSDVITNYSDQETRRIDLVIGIGYNDSIPQARDLIEGVLQADQRVLDDPAPTIMVLELGSSSVDIAVRPWVRSADYWATRGDLLERIKVTLEDNGLTIPYPQTDVHLFNESRVA